MMRDEFISALENRDIHAIRKIPKSDLHNHGVLGGNPEYFENKLGVHLNNPNLNFNNIKELENWTSTRFFPYFDGKSGFEKAIEAAFVQAKNDGVAVLDMSIDLSISFRYAGNIKSLISNIDAIHKKIAPHILFRPELGFKRDESVETIRELLEPFFEYDYFKSIDLYGDELARPIQNFKEIYRSAKKRNFILKAHAGEFGSAESVQEAVEELELDQVQHGIAAADSVQVMQWLAQNEIQLNVCPTSNIRLKRVRSYKEHPIRELFDNGIKVTLNTDDVVLFHHGVSEEFLALYNADLFSAQELNEIRENGLNSQKGKE